MFVGMESIFWLTRYSNRVNFMNKKELKTRGFAVDAGFSGEPHYRKLVVIEQYPFTAEHRCLGQTGTCSDFCVPVPEGAKCLCPIGKSGFLIFGFKFFSNEIVQYICRQGVG